METKKIARYLFVALVGTATFCGPASEKLAAEESRLLGCWTENTLNKSEAARHHLKLCFMRDGNLSGAAFGPYEGGDFEGSWRSADRTLTIMGLDQDDQHCSFELQDSPKLLSLSGCNEAGKFSWDGADYDHPQLK